MIEKKDGLNKLKNLVERFEYHLEEYKKGNYNETQTRNDFINPFFEALGWDINNRQGLAESYREVIHEDKIKIGGHTKAPDYCFTIYGQRKFFVEAKKPSVSIKDSIDPAYQLRRYGWSAKMPISIITDFEEFSIYDCTIKPTPQDKASVARINYFTYRDYLKEFDFLWDTFSKEMVLKGSFDKFVSSNKGKKGTADVDAEFLKSLDSWRDLMARNIVNRNKEIDEDTLNFSLQKIMDRMIFLRICEDRGIEPEETLFETIGTNIFEKLKTIFHIADQKYNSGLFDYKKDKITDSLIIDDKILKTIIEEMYYPKCPYEFSVIPVEILGHSYEQYLGKVIRITPGHIIKIETKPEVRKAGGVYYTPQYIVDYIVKNTVGKIVEEKTPEEIADIRICDPACGSGSFLLGAYQFLLDWHRDYYKNNDVKKKEKFLTPDGNLTTAIKKQILLNNIFGVDIDTNAVEVTKLSLMLKAMEGESNASINEQMQLFHERVLPTLDNNIKSGNSLIDLDFYDSQIDFEPGVEKKIKPFNWESAFPQVFGSGDSELETGDKGFDVVIGNPPYYLVEEKIQKDYYSRKYKFTFGKLDLYKLFIEKSLNILKSESEFSFIIPNTLLTIPSAAKLREYLLLNGGLNCIVNFWGDVFLEAKLNSIIIFAKKNSNINHIKIIVDKSNLPSSNTLNEAVNNSREIEIDVISISKNFELNISITSKANILIKKITDNSTPLFNYAKYTLGMQVYHNSIHKKEEIENRIYHSKSIIDNSYYKEIGGINVQRYFFNSEVKEYVSYGSWCYNKPDFIFFTEPRILIREIMSEYIVATYCNDVVIPKKAVIIVLPFKINIYFLLGIINSKILGFYVNTIGEKSSQRLFPRISLTTVRNLPIVNIDNQEKKQKHDEIVRNVETMLQLNKDLQSATLPEQKEQLQARISYTDKKIDKLVYQLYDLTEEEIKIVEGG